MLNNRDRKLVLDLVDKYGKEKESGSIFIDNENFIKLINEFYPYISELDSLNYIPDIKKEVIDIVSKQNQSKYTKDNILVSYNDIKMYTNNQLVLEFFKLLDLYSLYIIVRPDKNLFIDINYYQVFDLILGKISTEALQSASVYHTIQKNSIIDFKGNLDESKYSKLHSETIISCDFVKDGILHEFACKALDELKCHASLYNSKKIGRE